MSAAPQLENLFTELKSQRVWLPWKAVKKEGGKISKVPYNTKGAKANDRSSDVTFDELCAFLKGTNGDYAGVGIHIPPGIVCVDLDNCVSLDAVGNPVAVASSAKEIVQALPTYCELSPNKTGLHLWMRGSKPGKKCRRDSVEIYSGDDGLRFMTVTGWHLGETPTTIEACDISSIYEEMVSGTLTESKESAKSPAPAATNESVKIQSEGKTLTSKLELLMCGDILSTSPFVVSDKFGNSVEYPSQSEGDGALAVLLAFKHNGDVEKMDADFRVSSLYREKWEREDYSAVTLNSAVAFWMKNGGTNSPATAKAEPSAWGEPRKFEMGLPPVLPFDVTCLPHCLRPLVLDVFVRVGVPVEFVAVALINALAGVVGRRAFVYPRENDNTWKESLNLWGGIIAGPGDKKTPLINAILEPANRVRLEWDAENRAAQKQYKTELAAYKSAMKKIAADKKAVEKIEKDAKKKIKKGELIESQESNDAKTPAEVKAEMFLSPPVEPINRVFMVNEATPEWLQNANAENPEGLFIVQDELAGWVAEQDATGRELERSLYLAAWNGNSVHGVGRVTRDGRIARLCWSLFGGFQPDTVRKFLEACLIVVDGTFPRFQNFVWPDPLDPVARKGVDRTPNEEAIRSVEKVFRALLDMKEDQVSLHFAKGLAREKFNIWYDVLNDRIFAEKAPHIQQHLAKYSGFMAILAGLFQLVDLVANQNTHVKDGEVTDDTPIAGFREIDADHAEQAIKLVAILESHARRIYSCIKSATQLSEESLATHILAGDIEDGLTVRDIRRNNWKGLTRDDQIEDALVGLEELKWVREVEVERSPKGGRPTKRWDINPALKSGSNRRTECR